jgi:branched-chain amino acid transport system ATP-binding protein
VSSNSLLSISNLTVEFGGLRALDDVFLNLESNQVVGLIGPNGAGKTTLFNAICGLVKPTSGTLTLNGQAHDWPATHDLTSLGISRTLQGVGLFPDLTVAENVMIGAQKFSHTGLISAGFGRNKKDERALRERAHWALERVYAGSLSDKRADSLSYPDTKRVAIARALVSEPKILMLDEPAGGLGAQDIDWMNDLIRNLRSAMSILIVEHHMDVVMSVCDQLYVLNFGEVISSGSSETVRRDPAVIAAYLGTGVV